MQSPYWRVVPVLILAHVLQTTWLSGPFWNLARPDLPFLVALSAALIGGLEIGVIMGVVAGALGGLAAAWHPGSFLVSRTIPTAILGALSTRFSVFHPIAPPLCAFVATLLSEFFFMMMSPTDFPVSWWIRHSIAVGITHAILIWPIFGLVVRLVKPPQRSLFTTP